MDRITRMRAGILILAFSLVLSFFAFRLYDLQIIETGGKVDNVKFYTTEIRVKAPRGEITDRNGNVLVSNRVSYDLMFNHYVICSAKGRNELLLELVQLCREMDIVYTDHFPVTEQAPFTYIFDEVGPTWQGYFQKYLPEKGGMDSDISAPLLLQKLREHYSIPQEWSDVDARAVIGIRYELDLRQGITNLPNYIFLEDADSAALAAILELNTPGLKAEATTARQYNTKFGAHILGHVGAITASQWDSLYKDKEGYSKDTLVGQDGLEEAFESYLHGVDGIRVDETYTDGTLRRSYWKTVNGKEMRPVPGQNVELSIDLNLQTTAEEQLEALITDLRQSGENIPEGEEKPDGSDAEGGAVVVLDVRTGQVLACASYPTYNLATFREDFDQLEKDPYAPLFNRALLATYPPGSTYKMSMVVAAVNSGAISRMKTIRDEGVYMKYAASDFTPQCLIYTNNGWTHGAINAMEALRDSCNYYFYEIGDMLDIEVIDETAKQLGLGESTGVELFEYLGHRANPETKQQLHEGDFGRWYAADKVMTAIGQSENRFTPMQLCVYTATLANRGTRYKATFLNRVISSDYSSVTHTNLPEIVNEFSISDEAYLAYTEGMRMVATEGTAARFFKDYPIAIAAKTGTAQTDAGDKYSDNGAFVCYAPYEQPEIAVVVYGEKAGHGTTMAQIAKALLDTYFADRISGNAGSGESQLG